VHDRLRGRAPAPARGLVYGIGILGVEYAAGRVLRRALGAAPWDYSYAGRSIDGLVRPDFLPLWALFGLGLEARARRAHASGDPIPGRPSRAGAARLTGSPPTTHASNPPTTSATSRKPSSTSAAAARLDE